jgi:hypothetical protein
MVGKSEGSGTMTTLFVIRHTSAGYAVATICLNDGGIGGAGFFRDADKAREVIQSAYKTPLREVDAETFQAAREVLRESGAYAREAVAVG